MERLRLLLSTYQDGSGMLRVGSGRTLPGWRDFERSVAAAFGGETQESKFIFDVLIPRGSKGRAYGISCKMRRELRRLEKDGRVTIELSNSAKRFHDRLRARRIERTAYRTRAKEVGTALVGLVEEWKRSASAERNIYLRKSCYLTLMYNKIGDYQLHWFRISLPRPASLDWYYPRAGRGKLAGHLNGDDRCGGRVFEWYGDSGGQLKYYPLAATARWGSSRFKLEPIPAGRPQLSLLSKAKAYFPRLWAKTTP
jgi:hypothetical protein